jgi:hypothetical protein
MSKQNFNGSALGQLGSLIDEINAHSIKVAAAKKAEEAGGTGSAKKDPGGYQGASSHPSAKADGGLHAAPVGFRSKENDEDVKSDVPDNVSVAPENHQDSDYDQVQTGVKKSPTGEDPSTEDAYKSDKEDPGTSHPANTEKNGVNFVITSNGLKKVSDFLPNIRKAIENGLSETAALKAVTTGPATLLNVADKVGSLKKGMLANFIIASGKLFDEKTTIYQNWVQGQNFSIKALDIKDANGKYSLSVKGQSYNLEISGEAGAAA